jgi:hypothetical protein
LKVIQNSKNDSNSNDNTALVSTKKKHSTNRSSTLSLGMDNPGKLLYTLARKASTSSLGGGSSSRTMPNPMAVDYDENLPMDTETIGSMVQQLFRRLDVDGDGLISWWEWKSVLTALLCQPDPQYSTSSTTALTTPNKNSNSIAHLIDPIDPLFISFFAVSDLIKCANEFHTFSEEINLISENRDKRAMSNNMPALMKQNNYTESASIVSDNNFSFTSSMMNNGKFSKKLTGMIKNLRQSNNILTKRLEDALIASSNFQSPPISPERENPNNQFLQDQIQQLNEQSLKYHEQLSSEKTKNSELVQKLNQHENSHQLSKQILTQSDAQLQSLEAVLNSELESFEKNRLSKRLFKQKQLNALLTLFKFFHVTVYPYYRKKTILKSKLKLNSKLSKAYQHKKSIRDRGKMRLGVLRLQALVRGFVMRRRFAHMKQGMIKIQNAMRRKKAKVVMQRKKTVRSLLLLVNKKLLARAIWKLWKQLKEKKRLLAEKKRWKVYQLILTWIFWRRYTKRKHQKELTKKLSSRQNVAASIIQQQSKSFANKLKLKERRKCLIESKRFYDESTQLSLMKFKPFIQTEHYQVLWVIDKENFQLNEARNGNPLDSDEESHQREKQRILQLREEKANRKAAREEAKTKAVLNQSIGSIATTNANNNNKSTRNISPKNVGFRRIHSSDDEQEEDDDGSGNDNDDDEDDGDSELEISPRHHHHHSKQKSPRTTNTKQSSSSQNNESNNSLSTTTTATTANNKSNNSLAITISPNKSPRPPSTTPTGSSTGRRTPTIRKEPKYHVNDKIEGLYAGNHQWYPATITNILVKETPKREILYTLLYEDGDMEENIYENRIRLKEKTTSDDPLESNPIHNYQINDKVESYFVEYEQWYRGHIKQVNPLPNMSDKYSYVIEYDDGDVETNVLPQRIRYFQKYTGDFTFKFAVNDKVEARYNNGKEWFTGKVTKCKRNEDYGPVYTIVYEDGDQEDSVKEFNMKKKLTPEEIEQLKREKEEELIRIEREKAEARARAEEEEKERVRQEQLLKEQQEKELQEQEETRDAAAGKKKKPKKKPIKKTPSENEPNKSHLITKFDVPQFSDFAQNHPFLTKTNRAFLSELSFFGKVLSINKELRLMEVRYLTNLTTVDFDVLFQKLYQENINLDDESQFPRFTTRAISFDNPNVLWYATIAPEKSPRIAEPSISDDEGNPISQPMEDELQEEEDEALPELPPLMLESDHEDDDDALEASFNEIPNDGFVPLLKDCLQYHYYYVSYSDVGTEHTSTLGKVLRTNPEKNTLGVDFRPNGEEQQRLKEKEEKEKQKLKSARQKGSTSSINEEKERESKIRDESKSPELDRRKKKSEKHQKEEELKAALTWIPYNSPYLCWYNKNKELLAPRKVVKVNKDGTKKENSKDGNKKDNNKDGKAAKPTDSESASNSPAKKNIQSNNSNSNNNNGGESAHNKASGSTEETDGGFGNLFG